MKPLRAGLAIISGIFATALIGADPTAMPSASPEPSMPGMQFFDAISNIYRQFTADGQQALRQLQVDMAGAITPIHRAALGELIGQSVVSDDPNHDTLSQQIDALLSPSEKQNALAAFSKYLATQEGLGEKINAAVAQEFPQYAGTMHSERQDPSQLLRPDDVGMLLSRWLALPQTMLSPPQLAPGSLSMSVSLSGSSPQDSQLRESLRGTLLSVLTPAHRAAIASAIGQFAVSAIPDRTALSHQVLAILSPSEQQAIVAAYAAFQSQQQASTAQYQAQMQRFVPNHIFLDAPAGDQAPGQGQTPNAGAIVVDILLFPQPMSHWIRPHPIDGTEPPR